MKSISVFCAFIVILTSRAALAGVIFVNADAAGANNGASWVNARTTLQSALDQAASGDEIRVAAGTYRPTARTEPDDPRSAAFQMKNGVAIYGGFNGTEENREERNWMTNVTILSGDIGTEGDNSDNCYHVFYHAESLALNNTAILDGATITGSYNEGFGFGGGMYNNGSSPMLVNCTFSNNSGERGGGMYNANFSSPTLTNCVFTGNSSNSEFALDDGGGMYNFYHSSPIVTNCTFSGNTAGSGGGGMYNSYDSSPILTNCTFSGNSASYGGGMVNHALSSPTLVNCSFFNNSAESGGGMCNISSSPTLVNCSFSGNSAGRKGGAMFNGYSVYLWISSPFSPTITNCIFWGNAAPANSEIYNSTENVPTITYSDIQGGYPGEGNIDADPLFIHQAEGYLHLKAGSPCIDAGDNAAPGVPALDFEGNPRVMDGDLDGAAAVDMGVDEFFHCATFNPLTKILYIPCLNLGNLPYWVRLRLVSSYFELTALGENSEMGFVSECASFDYQSNVLHAPCVYIEGISHWVDMRLAPDADPRRLDILGYAPNQ